MRDREGVLALCVWQEVRKGAVGSMVKKGLGNV